MTSGSTADEFAENQAQDALKRGSFDPMDMNHVYALVLAATGDQQQPRRPRPTQRNCVSRTKRKRQLEMASDNTPARGKRKSSRSRRWHSCKRPAIAHLQDVLPAAARPARLHACHRPRDAHGPRVRLNLRMREAPLAAAEIGYKHGDKFVEGVQCEDAAIGKWIYRQIKHIWKTYLPAIVRAQVWGWSAGEVTLKLNDDGLIDVDKLEARHASDCRLLMYEKQRWGVRFDRIEDKGYVCLPFPYCWFHAYDAEEGEVYGTPNLLGLTRHGPTSGSTAALWITAAIHAQRRVRRRKLTIQKALRLSTVSIRPTKPLPAHRGADCHRWRGYASSVFDERGNRVWELDDPTTTGGLIIFCSTPKTSTTKSDAGKRSRRCDQQRRDGRMGWQADTGRSVSIHRLTMRSCRSSATCRSRFSIR